MIPFSDHNNSRDVNLYTQQSRIPYLYKDSLAEYGIPSQPPSLFLKCYSDDIYEAILEDLRAHYIAISNQDFDEASSYGEELGDAGNDFDYEQQNL